MMRRETTRGGEESESESRTEIWFEITRICALIGADVDEDGPVGNVGLLWATTEAADEGGDEGTGVRGEVGTGTVDARKLLRVWRGTGIDGVRRLEDSVNAIVSSFGGLGVCNINNG